ncbi:MAG TPA: SDR family oxidoreductase, partial [Polyangiaceae bacterium]|nr:SDR family oxidoreductase [Polyangiaceae bacterium]
MSMFSRFLLRAVRAYRPTPPNGLALFALAGAAAFVGARKLMHRPAVGARALVLGGSRGLGLLLAEELVARGSRVVIAARDDAELTEAVAAIEHSMAAEGRISAVRCDVEDEGDIALAVHTARERLGGIDVLVNNAGVIQVGPLEAMDVADFEHALRVHLRAPLIASLAVVEEMRARRAGRIINISSIGGLVPIPHMAPYVASKFALTGLSQGLQVALAKDGISVTTVCPGLMRTGSSHRATFKSKHRSEHAWFSLGAATPLTSMNARRAARQILNAAAAGKGLVVLSWQAKLLSSFHALAPGMSLRVLALVNRLLPAFGGIGKQALEGRYSASRWAP